MTEEQLQSKIVIAFSQSKPKKRGQLFHVSNERNNKLQAIKAVSIGIVPGVADLLFISKKFNVATELKVNGSRHKVSSLKTQIWWGRVWEGMGNTWRLCTNVNDALSCYNRNFQGFTLDEMEILLKNIKTQTYKIEQTMRKYLDLDNCIILNDVKQIKKEPAQKKTKTKNRLAKAIKKQKLMKGSEISIYTKLSRAEKNGFLVEDKELTGAILKILEVTKEDLIKDFPVED